VRQVIVLVSLLCCLVVKWTTDFTTGKLCCSDSFCVSRVCSDELLSSYPGIVHSVWFFCVFRQPTIAGSNHTAHTYVMRMDLLL